MTKAEMLFAAIATIGVLFCRAATDEQIKHSLFISNCYVDDADAALAEFRYARQLCGADSNRFARLICEVAHTNNTRVVRGMISDLGTYGTPAQLPFLYSMASNSQYGASAVKSILRLEGLTSNSVDVTGMYLSMTNVDFEYRADVCKTLLRATANVSDSQEMRQAGRECALRYARNANRYVWDVDTVFIETDSTYRNSRRRLEVLRSAYSLGVSQYQIAYVTNAINELVAYPEADLPD